VLKDKVPVGCSICVMNELKRAAEVFVAVPLAVLSLDSHRQATFLGSLVLVYCAWYA
jgi:hypothetical protein